ncbi:4Fe-4S binding protein [Desulfofundulus sp. TPOSR]|nr:4Fe-4S binding protein [Desulfofundulus sp. TPOSR]
MFIIVISVISQGKKVRDTECILCMECRLVCPTGVIA